MRVKKRWLFIAGILLVVMPGSVATCRTLIIDSGWDLILTPPEGSQSSAGPHANPAGFIEPGSAPFEGTVALEGAPPGTVPACGDPVGDTDTVIARQGAAELPPVPGSDTVPVAIEWLSLRSTAPIDLGPDGSCDVYVGLSPTPAPATGTEQITNETPAGGTLDITVPVRLLFTFVRRSDGQLRVRDMGAPGTEFVDEWTAQDVPWSWEGPSSLLDTSCDSNFRPTVQDGATVVVCLLSGPYTHLPVRWPPATGSVPVQTSSWGSLKAAYR
jgi:hypothetical protein